MEIRQFYDKGLAHSSYAIYSEGEMALVDPARDPQAYYDHAKSKNAKITAIFETHPHADFVSSHLEISKTTGADIYVSQLAGAEYPHKSFDEGEQVQIGRLKLRAMHTPGHSPDSISILLFDENDKEYAVFTGDTLFIGDVGRPDLREKAGKIQAKREELAKQMYHTTREKLMKLAKDTLVYPAHGPGTLCGKSMSSELYGTIGQELRENYALQPMDELTFVNTLLKDQPYIPKYFPYNVELNKKGAPSYEESIAAVPRLLPAEEIQKGVSIIDTRSVENFSKAFYPNSINIVNALKFETWLGSIVGPEEEFYLIAQNESELEEVIRKSAKIGYECNIKGALVAPEILANQLPEIDLEKFKNNQEDFTILDVRNKSEAVSPVFSNSINIPLHELRERATELPADKAVMVHCAGGSRSATAASILANLMKVPVYNLGADVRSFNNIMNSIS